MRKHICCKIISDNSFEEVVRLAQIQMLKGVNF